MARSRETNDVFPRLLPVVDFRHYTPTLDIPTNPSFICFGRFLLLYVYSKKREKKREKFLTSVTSLEKV